MLRALSEVAGGMRNILLVAWYRHRASYHAQKSAAVPPRHPMTWLDVLSPTRGLTLASAAPRSLGEPLT